MTVSKTCAPSAPWVAAPATSFRDDALGAFSMTGLLNRNDYVFADGSSEHFNSAAMEWDYKRYLYGKNLELSSQGGAGRALRR